MQLFFKIFFITLVALFTVSCAGRHTPKIVGGEKNYQERFYYYYGLECCKPLNELNVTSFKDEITFTMEENADLIRLNGFQTNYMFFELPKERGEHLYGIRSFYVDHKFAYIPQVTALNEHYNVIESTQASYIQYQHQTLIWDDSHFWLYFKFNTKNNPDQKYFIVHLQAEIGTDFRASPKEYTNVDTMFVNGQPVSHVNKSTSFSFPTLVSPSGVLLLQKLGFWNKPVNNNIFYNF